MAGFRQGAVAADQQDEEERRPTVRHVHGLRHYVARAGKMGNGGRYRAVTKDMDPPRRHQAQKANGGNAL